MQDVYTQSGIGLTRGNDFPASEVTKVSQNSRHLWQQQLPFDLKRSRSSSHALATAMEYVSSSCIYDCNEVGVYPMHLQLLLRHPWPVRHPGSYKSSDCWCACMCAVQRVTLSVLHCLWRCVCYCRFVLSRSCFAYMLMGPATDMALPVWVLSNLTAVMYDCQGNVCAGLHV